MRKIPARLHGTNFCTSSSRFAPSFVRQPNGPECTQVVQNAPKRQFRVNGVDRVRSLRKILMRLRGTNFCTRSACFALSYVMQPNGLKCIQIVQNTPKHVFGVQWGGSGAFVAKNSDATSCHELLHQFGPFCTECGNTTKLSQMHSNSTNAPKHEVRVQWGGSDASL